MTTDIPLTQSQLDAFVRDGFLHIPGFIPESELTQPDSDSMALIERGLNDHEVDDRWLYQDDPETGQDHCHYRIDGILKDDMPPSFQMLMAYPPLLKAVSQLMNGDHFATSVHSLVFKLPHHGVPALWHQDPVRIFRFPVFNVDIYLDEATTENGCLRVFPGSHLAGYQNPRHHPEFINSWTGGNDEASASDAVAVPTQRGDVIVHATSVIHGSPWNRSADLRRTIYYHFDHRSDVQLAGQRWPQAVFDDAVAITRKAIEYRASQHPCEQPFEYPTI